MKFLEENEAYIDCANDDINTTNANGKFLSRLLMNMSQNEIERTSARNNAKNNLSGSSSLANNGIQSARQLSKVNNHDFRKYD